MAERKKAAPANSGAFNLAEHYTSAEQIEDQVEEVELPSGLRVGLRPGIGENYLRLADAAVRKFGGKKAVADPGRMPAGKKVAASNWVIARYQMAYVHPPEGKDSISLPAVNGGTPAIYEDSEVARERLLNRFPQIAAQVNNHLQEIEEQFSEGTETIAGN